MIKSRLKKIDSHLERILQVIYEKKGEDILLLDLRRISPITDFFIIATASSTIHAQAITDELVAQLKKESYLPHHIEGYNPAQWVLLDYIDVVVHIFLPEVRKFYGLERLWGDAPQRRFVK